MMRCDISHKLKLKVERDRALKKLEDEQAKSRYVMERNFVKQRNEKNKRQNAAGVCLEDKYRWSGQVSASYGTVPPTQRRSYKCKKIAWSIRSSYRGEKFWRGGSNMEFVVVYYPPAHAQRVGDFTLTTPSNTFGISFDYAKTKNPNEQDI